MTTNTKLLFPVFLIFYMFINSSIYSQPEPGSSYFPLTIGNQWIYKTDDNYYTDTITIVDTQRIDGKSYYTVQYNSYELYLWFREENNKVYIRDTATFQPGLLNGKERLLYDFSSDTGSTWQVQLTDPNITCDYAGDVTLESKADTIETILGDFPDCYRFFRQVMCSDAGVYEEWFAPGIGRVSYNEMSFAGIRRYSLVYTNIITEVANQSRSNTLNEYKLWQNYPNPFNPTTKIRYSIPAVGTSFMKFIKLKVYDILGNEIATLVNEEKPAGNYEVEFDGSNLPSGVYFYRLQAGNYRDTKKFVLMK